MELVVDFAGEVHRLDPGESLTFGRDAGLNIDTNPYLHRRLGRFRCIGGTWWIHNLGKSITLEIADEASPSRISLAPGSGVPLAFAESSITFQAGSARYELSVTLDGRFPMPIMLEATTEEDRRFDSVDGISPAAVETVSSAAVSLNREQFLLLVALAEPRLRDRVAHNALPTNREAADRLGWSISKFNRKLDNLCVKFSRLGVAGLKGDIAGLATSRRENLVNHVIRVGIVSPDDLDLLDEN